MADDPDERVQSHRRDIAGLHCRVVCPSCLAAASMLALLSMFVVACSGGTEAEGFRVLKPPGDTKWPLTLESGRIVCHRKVLIPDSSYRHASRPLVLFKSEAGIYGVNGAASGVGGYPSIETVMVDKRLWLAGASEVVAQWIDAGLALCEGDRAKARNAIERARVIASQPLPTGVETVLSTDPKALYKRGIFLQTFQCEDRALEESLRGHWSRYDELMSLGRRDEAWELDERRLEKYDDLMASCKEALREREGLTVDQHRQILSEGLARRWPTE